MVRPISVSVEDALNNPGVVRPVSVEDVLNNSVSMPFLSKPAWLVTQEECPDIRVAANHLRSGTAVPKKQKDAGDLRRYMFAYAVYLAMVF